jgi:hypothetical protein
LAVFKFLFFFIIFIINASAESNNFLTEYEYAMMLYSEPRGLSCAHCHGKKGRTVGQITYFKHYPKKNRIPKEKIVKLKPIYNISFKKFRSALLSSKKRFMPTYKLSNSEIKLLFYYLQKINGLVKKKKPTSKNKPKENIKK